jgi:hypothetical protein
MDKISYSMNFKVNTGNYESVGFHISYETTVKEGENPSKTLKRAQFFVEKKSEEKLDELRSIKSTISEE